MKFPRLDRVRRMNEKEKTRYYIKYADDNVQTTNRTAGKRVSVIALFFTVLTLIEGVVGIAFDPAKATSNKEMNFKVHPDNGSLPNFLNHETGDVLDNTNALYDERRWTFGWGADLILRFEKGYSFCTSYVLLPAENLWPTGVRIILYMFCLFYLFLGVAIISDVFMSGIEQITAEREKIVFKKEEGDEKPAVVMYTVWNETVANLTLLALGSSAPEILLSVLETCNNLDKVPGELGPSTIVGSAAFNLLCITAICMWSLEHVKKIKEFGVFLITSGSSVFAYIWLLVVLQWNSPDVIEMWEAFVTFLFFPLLVSVAYLQDRRWFRPGGGDTVPDEEVPDRRNTKILSAQLVDCTEDEVMDLVKATKSSNGLVTEESLSDELYKQHPPKLNRGHYRINAIRNLVSKSNVIREVKKGAGLGNKIAPSDSMKKSDNNKDPGVVEFLTSSYSILEGDGEIVLKVQRTRGSTGRVNVRYFTQELTAVDGVHYIGKDGTIVFEDGEMGEASIKVPIIDNDVRNADMLFTCKIETDPTEVLGETPLAVVTIIDDDLPGEVRFSQPAVVVPESDGHVKIEVIRENGSTGSLLVQYRTMDGTGSNSATAPEAYSAAAGSLQFGPGETKKVIEVPLIDSSTYEKSEHFFVTLVSVESKSGGKLGHLVKCRVDITSDTKMASLVKNVLEKVRNDGVNDKIKTNTWGGQFRDSMNIGGGDEVPTTFEYVMHALTFFWKVLFACVPPTAICGGWACFGVSLAFIGMVTAMVAEIAGLLGCVMELKDSVTAITFVALGTSLPDTFASKQAAENEDYVDAAIGNVTGSNSVNVFLGLGLPWIIASIYYESKGECYIVPSGALGFSVTIFTICAVVCILLLFVLRGYQGGELGGPLRKPVAVFLASLWFIYIITSSLKAYDHFSFPGTSNNCPCECSNRGILPWSGGTGEGSCLKAGCPL